MTVAAATQSKITYTSANVDWEQFHRQFDDALVRVRGELGRDYPLYIAGEPVTSPARPLVDTSPIDIDIMLGRFSVATAQHVDRAIAAAKAAQRDWARKPWRDRRASLPETARLIPPLPLEPAAVVRPQDGMGPPQSDG